MRRATTLAGVAALATVALGLSAVGAAADTIKKKKQFDTTVTAAFTQTSPAGEEYVNPSGSFSGQVSSPKRTCVKNREVTIRQANGPNVGTTGSGKTGEWSVQANNLAPGQYTVEVDKKKIFKDKDKPNGDHVHKKIVCSPVTATVAVP
jgi:hypothetical protein